ncbi:MAG: hypothetical protein ACLU4Y_05220 [Pseudoruminococcus massiliensis]
MDKEAIRQYKKETYELYKRLHLCTACHQQDAYTLNGRALCFECGEKNNARIKDRYKNNADVRAKEKEYRQQLREKYKENKLCTRCGKPLEFDTTKKSCKRCLAKMRQFAAERRMKKGIMPRVLFDGTERCVICGKQEIVKGYKMCNKHLPIFQKTMLKNRKQINNYFVKVNRAFWEAKNATN